MKLYKITFHISMYIPNFSTPMFIESKTELEALTKFIQIAAEVGNPNRPPNEIKVTEICKINQIIKSE